MADNIEQAIYVTVQADTDIYDDIGNRFYFLKAEQGCDEPYFVFRTISDPHTPMTFDRPGSGQARVQITGYDDDQYTLLTTAHKIRDLLDQSTEVALDSVDIAAINCSGILLIPQPDDDGYAATFDAIVQYFDP